MKKQERGIGIIFFRADKYSRFQLTSNQMSGIFFWGHPVDVLGLDLSNDEKNTANASYQNEY